MAFSSFIIFGVITFILYTVLFYIRAKQDSVDTGFTDILNDSVSFTVISVGTLVITHCIDMLL